MADFAPTAEQQAALDAFRTRGSLVLEAGAGTGKTSTLKLLALAAPQLRGVYLAYNRAIANDARAAFPRTVQCATAHSFAMRAVGKDYRHRLDAPRVPVRETVHALGAKGIDLGTRRLADSTVARLAMETVARFCNSADTEIDSHHVPIPNGVDDGGPADALRGVVKRLARTAWEDLVDPRGRLRFTHDVYLKLWSLTDPQLPCDYVMLDEAQDANPAIAHVVDLQHAQRIMVGDACQAIYGWRGAIDAMSTFDADHRLALTQSFRFGPAIAAEANRWLDLLDARLRIVGTPTLASRVDVDLPTRPDAILCRTNAGAMGAVLRAQLAGTPAALVGGGDEILRFAEAAIDLKAGRGTAHPELCAFDDWAQVIAYVQEDHAGRELQVFVDLVEDHGAPAIVRAAQQLVDEHHADVIVSTAHKAKGREWHNVRVDNDFGPYEPGEIPPDEDLMLAYVTVTRARTTLERGSLAMIDHLDPADPASRRPTPRPATPTPPAAATPMHAEDADPGRPDAARNGTPKNARASDDDVFTVPLLPVPGRPR